MALMKWSLVPLAFLICMVSCQSSGPTRISFPPTPSGRSGDTIKPGCPRTQDIHPCECIEIPNPGAAEGDGNTETVAFCKTIRNAQVLQNAMKGMQGHIIDFMVLDSCKLPPFPNGLFFNIDIKWMEILNSTIQFKNNFFECASNCW